VAGQRAVVVLAASEKRGVVHALGSTTETGRMKLGRMGRGEKQDRKSDTARDSLEQGG
jgi:hypothetical protein